MPLFTLGNTHFTIQLYPEEPVQTLYRLRQKFSYNDARDMYQLDRRVMGDRDFEIIDYTNADQVLHMAEWASDYRYVQNGLCKIHNELTGVTGRRLMYNFVEGWYFDESETWNGDAALFSVQYNKKRTTAIRIGLLRSAFVFFKKDMEAFGWKGSARVKDVRKNLIFDRITGKPTYKLGETELWEQQKDVVRKVRETLTDSKGKYFHGVALDLAVNTGKSYIGAALLKQFKGINTILLFRRTDLAEKACLEFLDMGFDVGTIFSKKGYTDACKYVRNGGCRRAPQKGIRPLTIAMVPTLARRMSEGVITMEMLKFFHVGLIDECHEFVQKQSLSVYDSFYLGLSIGMSGTLFDDFSGKNRATTMGLFGSQRYKISYASWSDQGKNIDITYKVIHRDIRKLAFRSYMKDPTDFVKGIVNGRKEAKSFWVYRDKGYLDDICSRIEAHPDEQIMIYTGRMMIDDMKYMAEHVKKRFPDEDIRLVWGASRTKQRDLLDFKEGKFRIMFGNQVVGIGKNLNNMSVVIYSDNSHQKKDFIQGPVGRLARLGILTSGTIYDYRHYDLERILWKSSLYREYFATLEDINLTVEHIGKVELMKEYLQAA